MKTRYSIIKWGTCILKAPSPRWDSSGYFPKLNWDMEWIDTIKDLPIVLLWVICGWFWVIAVLDSYTHHTLIIWFSMNMIII